MHNHRNLILILWFLFVAPALAAETLTNSDVQALTAAGLAEAVIVSKIAHATETDFNLSVEDLIALKEAGLSPKVINAMLQWSDPATKPAPSPTAQPAQPPQPASPDSQWREDFALSAARVVLVTAEGEQPLRLQRGEMSSTGFGAFRLLFQDYPGLHAKIRTRDTRPVLIVRSNEPLTQNRYFVARLDVDTDDECRSLKIGSGKKRFKVMFGGNSRAMMQPDADWTVGWSAEEIEEGIWRLQVSETLKPGEYGLFVALGSATAQGGGLFGFGVD